MRITTARGRTLANCVKKLEFLRLSYGAAIAAERLTLLRTCRGIPLGIRAEILRRYHEILLFIVSYPDNSAIHTAAEAELRRLGRYLLGQNENSRVVRSLTDSGIEGSVSCESFSHDAWRWLAERCGVELKFDPVKSKFGEEFDELLQSTLLHGVGDAVLNGDVSTQELMKILSGAEGNSARWLAHCMKNVSGDAALVDQVFGSLDFWMSWRLHGLLGSRTRLRIHRRDIFYHPSGLKSLTPTIDVVRQALPRPVELSRNSRQRIVDVGMGTLLARSRETDPITYANLEDVHLFRLERGVEVAVYGLVPERRLPIESYIGFLAAKNGVPVAYGGAWILGPRAEIGVNIFDTFRGADSYFLFACIMRVYHGFLGAQRFLVQPYQFGEGNKEAIQSGAFWFYYRLGFRPVDAGLNQLAKSEAKKIENSRDYRTSYATLRRLASSKIALDLSGASQQAGGDLDVSEIGLALAKFVGNKFSGDIKRAEQQCEALSRSIIGKRTVSKLDDTSSEGFRRLSVLVPLVTRNRRLNKWQRKGLFKILATKWGLRETDYVRAIQSQPWFIEALSSLTSTH